MKKKLDWKNAASTALFIVMLGLLCWYVIKNREEMLGLLTLDIGTVALMLFLALCGSIVNCLYHKAILDTYDIPLSLTDWMGVVYVGNAIAYVLPMRADLVITAAYYKKTKGLAYVKSASIAAGNVVFGFAFSLLQMLAALLCTGWIEGVWSAALWVAWGALSLGIGALITLSLLVQKRNLKLLEKVRVFGKIVEGFNALLRNRKLLMRLLFCLISKDVVHLLLYIICFRALGLEVTIYQALFYNSVSWMITIIAIVPGNIGVKEAVMGVATSLTGMLFQNGVAVSLLQRVAVMLVYIVMGIAFVYPVYRKWNRGISA